MKGMKLLRAMSALDDKDIQDAWEQPVTALPESASAAKNEAGAEHPLLFRIMEIGALAACAALAVGTVFWLKGMDEKPVTADSHAAAEFEPATTAPPDEEPTGYAAATDSDSQDGKPAVTDATAVTDVTDSDAHLTIQPTEPGTTATQTLLWRYTVTKTTTTAEPEEKTTADPQEGKSKDTKPNQEQPAETTVTQPQLQIIPYNEAIDIEYPSYEIGMRIPELREWFDTGKGSNFRQYRAGDKNALECVQPYLDGGQDVLALFLRANELGHTFTVGGMRYLEVDAKKRLTVPVVEWYPGIAEQATALHVLILTTKPGNLPDIQSAWEERNPQIMRKESITEQQSLTQQILTDKLGKTSPADIRTAYDPLEIIPQLWYFCGMNDVTPLYELDGKYPVEYLTQQGNAAPYCIYKLKDGGSMVIFFNEQSDSLRNVSYPFIVYDLLQKQDFDGLKPGMTLEDVLQIDKGLKTVLSRNCCTVLAKETLHLVEGGFIRIRYKGLEMLYYQDNISWDMMTIETVEFIPNGGNVGIVNILGKGGDHFSIKESDYDVLRRLAKQ